jgi:hypothetical protein
VGYGNGGGAPNGCSGLGTNAVAGTDNFLFSTDVIATDPQVIFVMLFGSWFAEWDLQDDFMRSFLAAPTMGLAVVQAGVPHWFGHHMAMGEPIGYSTRLTMNNTTLYRNQDNEFTNAVYISVMGDPALRMEPVAPPSNPTATISNSVVALTWSPSPAPVSGYHVYRSTDTQQTFQRLTSSLLAGTSYVDANPSQTSSTYMVRAVLLQTNFSGSYYNPSQGAFTTPSTSNAMNIVVTAQLLSGQLVLSWNSHSGQSYHVLTSTALNPPS